MKEGTSTRSFPCLIPTSAGNDGTMVSVMIKLIEELKGEATGQLIDRGRVVDHLLDLRIASADEPPLLSLVDEVLAELPGKTVVETQWWQATLDRFASAAQPEPVT